MKTSKTKKFNDKTVKEFRNFSDSFIEDLAKSQEERRIYLQTALENYEQDQDLSALLLALRTIATDSSFGIQKIAQETSLNRQTLYKALSPKGNPSFALIDKIINALGMKLTVQLR